jgi:hypothetical protein
MAVKSTQIPLRRPNDIEDILNHWGDVVARRNTRRKWLPYKDEEDYYMEEEKISSPFPYGSPQMPEDEDENTVQLVHDALQRLYDAAKEHQREMFGVDEWKVPVNKEDLRMVLALFDALLRENNAAPPKDPK